MVLLRSDLSRPSTLKSDATTRLRRDGVGAELARRRLQSRSTPALGDARALHITATPLAPPTPYAYNPPLAPPTPYAYTPPAAPPPLPPEPKSAVDSFLVLEGSNKAALAAAAFAAAAEQNEAVLNALRRKELNEIHERIQAALDVFETEDTFDGGGGSGDDDDSDDGGGGGEGASAEALEAAKEKLMVMLLEYKTTCSSRRAVLGACRDGNHHESHYLHLPTAAVKRAKATHNLGFAAALQARAAQLGGTRRNSPRNSARNSCAAR